MLLLAMVQGLTEFLPVSSSGHLGLAQHFLNFNPPGMLFEVTTHAGTLLAVVIYYRNRSNCR
ncbi:MAG: undecaprenyl-diphosphate phosphatase [Planctomycetota bacterium]|nr:undecaprenyl-diphosphate phosphatase [Planctomycetota bacterium]